MNKESFIRQLEQLLMDIPEYDREDAIAYYNDYFDEAGQENEQNVIRELGSPEKVAQTIKQNLVSGENAQRQDYEEPAGYEQPRGYEEPEGNEGSHASAESRGYENWSQTNTTYTSNNRNTLVLVLVIIIAVLTLPVWSGLVAGIIGTVFGIGGSAVGLVVGGLVAVVTGFITVPMAATEGLAMAGVGALLTSIGLLLALLFGWIAVQWIPMLIKVIIKGCKKLIYGEQGGTTL